MRTLTSVAIVSMSLLSLAIAEKVYILNTVYKANWYRAHHLCLAGGMAFATILSRNESDQLEYQIRESGFDDNFWIAGTSLGNKPHYYWMGDTSAMKFRNWAKSNPVPSSEYCVGITGALVPDILAQWFSVDCERTYYFVCQKQIKDTN